MKLCAVSVDLDEIPNYFRIHGLDDTHVAGRTAVYDVAVGRLRAMAKDAGLPLTLFAIGADLERPEAAAKLKEAFAEGHEVANHSLNHRYELTRLTDEEMAHEVSGGADAIAKVVGSRPVGFRAPGYTMNDRLMSAVRDSGAAYDSSVFPCPWYWAAKTTAIGLIALRGRQSHSVVDTPKVLGAPTRPYRVGKPYFKLGEGLLEIPIQVTRGARLPFIGTSITLAGETGAAALARMCIGEPLVNLELHGIDVLDSDDGLEALKPHQVDVRKSKDVKLAALHAVYDVLRKAGYSFVTMQEAARAFSSRAA